MSLVLDCSLTMAWLYAEETTAAVRKVFELVEDAGAWVPSLWQLEVANVLEFGVRRGRSDSVFRDAALDDLAEFPIAIDAEMLAARVNANQPHRSQVHYAGNAPDAVAAVTKRAQDGDLIMTLGAGNVSQIGPQVLEALNA